MYRRMKAEANQMQTIFTMLILCGKKFRRYVSNPISVAFMAITITQTIPARLDNPEASMPETVLWQTNSNR
jgi:hypothetical protein